MNFKVRNIRNSIKIVGSYFCFGRWKPCFRCTKNLKFIDPNQQPNIQQNTIVSLPASQMAIAPSTNYLKYSKVWAKNPSRQENCKTKTIAQGKIKKDSTYLRVLGVLNSKNYQTHVKVRTLSSKAQAKVIVFRSVGQTAFPGRYKTNQSWWEVNHSSNIPKITIQMNAIKNVGSEYHSKEQKTFLKIGIPSKRMVCEWM